MNIKINTKLNTQAATHIVVCESTELITTEESVEALRVATIIPTYLAFREVIWDNTREAILDTTLEIE